MNRQQTFSRKWYHRRDGALGLCILSLGLAYVAGSRAIDTGSLQQYVLTFILIVFAADRLLATFTRRGHRSAAGAHHE